MEIQVLKRLFKFHEGNVLQTRQQFKFLNTRAALHSSCSSSSSIHTCYVSPHQLQNLHFCGSTSNPFPGKMDSQNWTNEEACILGIGNVWLISNTRCCINHGSFYGTDNDLKSCKFSAVNTIINNPSHQLKWFASFIKLKKAGFCSR